MRWLWFPDGDGRVRRLARGRPPAELDRRRCLRSSGRIALSVTPTVVLWLVVEVSRLLVRTGRPSKICPLRLPAGPIQSTPRTRCHLELPYARQSAARNRSAALASSAIWSSAVAAMSAGCVVASQQTVPNHCHAGSEDKPWDEHQQVGRSHLRLPRLCSAGPQIGHSYESPAKCATGGAPVGTM